MKAAERKARASVRTALILHSESRDRSPVMDDFRLRNDMIRPRMTLTAEDRKTDLVERLATEAGTRAGADKADSAVEFVRRYFALVAPDDIIYSSFDTLLGGALSLWEFGQKRTPGVPKIR